MNVGRQRDVADAVEHAEKVVDGRKFDQTIAEFSALQHFGFKHDLAVRRGKDKALADGDFAAGPHERMPAVVAQPVRSACTSMRPVGFSFSRRRVRRA